MHLTTKLEKVENEFIEEKAEEDVEEGANTTHDANDEYISPSEGLEALRRSSQIVVRLSLLIWYDTFTLY